jgi:4-hydroxy-tetrahydrodipicolinate synthase
MALPSSPLDGGAMAAVLTPLDRFRNPDPAMLIEHCERLLKQGCTGLAVLGTTGEANSLTVRERLALLDALGASTIDGGMLVPGVGCCAVPDTVALCRKALEVGAAGVLMLPPFYYKPASADGLFAAYSEVIQHVGDSRLRILLYHIPQYSGVPISRELIAMLTDAYPETVVDIKDSEGDFAGLKAAVEAFPGFRVFSGWDRHLLDLLRIGGAGTITACNNVAMRLSADLLAHWREPGADERQAALDAIGELLPKYPLIEALKETLARATGNLAWRTVRAPLLPLPPENAEALRRALGAAGFSPDLAA